MRRHHLEGQPLGKIPEFLAVGGADQLMQVIPAGAFLFLGVDVLEAFLLLFLQFFVFTQAL